MVASAIDPNNMTDQYNTKLSPEDEKAYQAWAVKNNKTEDTYDYDMRGAWLSGAKASGNGHFTDEYKKPNHPTFSDQSTYHGKKGKIGGKWGVQDGVDTFTPSPEMLKERDPEDLIRYFNKVEPNVRLLLPTKAP